MLPHYPLHNSLMVDKYLLLVNHRLSRLRVHINMCLTRQNICFYSKQIATFHQKTSLSFISVILFHYHINRYPRRDIILYKEQKYLFKRKHWRMHYIRINIEHVKEILESFLHF